MGSKWEIVDLDSFIVKARQVHGDRFDYSKTVYTKCINKVLIRCIKHDYIFEQAPNTHIYTKECCPICVKEAKRVKFKKPLSYYLDKASLTHNGKYDYSLIEEVTNCKDKVSIICPTHGLFYQTLAEHSDGAGCVKCIRESNGIKSRSSVESFLSKARAIHGDKYDYSNIEYKGSKSYLNIICPDHGQFVQRVDHHLTTSGCPRCGDVLKRDCFSSTRDEFIGKSVDIHGNKYDYSLVDYFNSQTKVTIVCPVHGEFRQVPNSHLSGNGCSSCGKYGYQPQNSGSFYILRITEDVIKFGITCNMPRRLREIKRSTVFDVDIIHCFDFDDGSIALRVEQDIRNDPSIVRNVVNKADMKEGMSETTYLSNISKILEYVAKHTPA